MTMDMCPKCGGELHHGYGLAGGGIGCYTACLNEECDYFDKVQDHTDDLCLCMFAVPGATPDRMAVRGPHHDPRCRKYARAGDGAKDKEGAP
jgi:hypothetical protein